MPQTEPYRQPLLKVKDVAAWLSVSVRTVETLIAIGDINPIWVLGQRRFTGAAIEAYLRSSSKRPNRRRGKRAGSKTVRDQASKSRPRPGRRAS